MFSKWPQCNRHFCPQFFYCLQQQAPTLPSIILILLLLLLLAPNAKVTSRCRKLRLNNKKVQQAVVDVDGGLELLQASGFELVFDESSPEPQASAAPVPIIGTPPQGTTDEGLACSESQVKANLPLEEASMKGPTSAESAGQATPTAAVDAAQTLVSNQQSSFQHEFPDAASQSDQVKVQLGRCPSVVNA